jgi:hypothetical protein
MIMFCLRHIQLISSSHVKTKKGAKSFMDGNFFLMNGLGDWVRQIAENANFAAFGMEKQPRKVVHIGSGAASLAYPNFLRRHQRSTGC